MEAYNPGSGTTSTVLKFLSAWTAQLHSAGYVSGVYSSGASGIHDLASKYGTSYLEPDDLWDADWNGKASASDPVHPGRGLDRASAHPSVPGRPAARPTAGSRSTSTVDYLDGSTAGPASVAPAPLPSVKVRPAVDGSVRLNATWPGRRGSRHGRCSPVRAPTR